MPSALERLMRPRHVALVGVSPEIGSVGGFVLSNLERWNFPGAIHLVSRARKEINGRACVASIDELPPDIDVAVLSVPRGAIVDAVAACGRRRIGTALVFASGFAEFDDDGRADQQRLLETARTAGVRLVGPNCMGMTNYADGTAMTFEPVPPRPWDERPAVAVVAQSGALSSMIRNALWGKGLGVSHVISSGNEVDVGTEDFLGYLIEDARTRVIALFMEQVRRPRDFLALARRARELRKPIVLMHPGRSERAQASAKTHTGALTGNHAVMTTLLRHEAVVMVDTLDELYDASEVLARFPPPTEGPGIITNSGAAKGFALDFCADIGFELPKLGAETLTRLKAALPVFAPVDNPVDTTAQVVKEPKIWTGAAAALLSDPAVGSLCLPIVPGAGQQAQQKVDALVPPILAAGKPALVAAMGDEFALPPEFEAFKRAGIPVWRSPERAFRALAHATTYGRALQADPDDATTLAAPALAPGTLPEHQAKAYLGRLGVAIPRGALARNEAEAKEIAHRIGYPVALKAQGAALAHKTEVGGVALRIADDASLAEAWTRMHERLAGHALDGMLVEEMAAPGVEMIVGARREGDWGPVVMVGLGGVWTEAFGDIRLIPPGLPKQRIAKEIGRLRGVKLLHGYRGAPPADIAAIAGVVALVGTLMRARPEIREIDINPLVAHANGATALDALIVVTDR